MDEFARGRIFPRRREIFEPGTFASKARELLASPRAQRGFHLAGGSLLAAAGVWAMMARRAP